MRPMLWTAAGAGATDPLPIPPEIKLRSAFGRISLSTFNEVFIALQEAPKRPTSTFRKEKATWLKPT